MLNLTQCVDYHARLRPEHEALIYQDQRVSWAELSDRVHVAAKGLAAQGIGPDDIVALVMKNSAAFIELFYAISHVGAIVLPLNYRLSKDEVTYIVNHAGAALVVADEELMGLTAELDLPVIPANADAQADTRNLFTSGVESLPAHRRTGSDLVRLMYTSGTTARPKGVMHTYDNFFWKIFDHIIALQLSAEDRLCSVGPLYHVGGCDLPGLGVHVIGGTIVVMRDFDPQDVLKTIASERITGIWLAPVMTNRIFALQDASRYDLSTLKWCIAGGERTPESRIRQFVSMFPSTRYVDAYGMTETVSGDAFMEPGLEIAKIGSVGRPVSFVEIEIRDDNDTELPSGETGEICMRGPKVTQGYWKDPETTAATIAPDGFLRSGDVGYVDQDGFLYLTDRKKDMIISGGENVSTSEIERVVYELPQVLEAAIIGKPHEDWGEVPVALIVLRNGHALTFEQLDAHCRERLAGFKCPKAMIVTDSLPRNPSGKVLKRVLRERF